MFIAFFTSISLSFQHFIIMFLIFMFFIFPAFYIYVLYILALYFLLSSCTLSFVNLYFLALYIFEHPIKKIIKRNNTFITHHSPSYRTWRFRLVKPIRVKFLYQGKENLIAEIIHSSANNRTFGVKIWWPGHLRRCGLAH